MNTINNQYILIVVFVCCALIRKCRWLIDCGISLREGYPHSNEMAEDVEIARKWPLHWMVWNNDVAGLVLALKSARNVRDRLVLSIDILNSYFGYLVCDYSINSLKESSRINVGVHPCI